jgi:hypothetical protein
MRRSGLCLNTFKSRLFCLLKGPTLASPEAGNNDIHSEARMGQMGTGLEIQNDRRAAPVHERRTHKWRHLQKKMKKAETFVEEEQGW